ncbi:MAG: hypothetical protein EA366_05840 [Spirulina sp. DLM2.Bin59]|nr:MAG: hypothetical protein EA366_05840 [Spirulina sp. DLM2.Bin59]
MADDPQLEAKIQRLHRLTVWGRWLAVGVAWLVLAPPALWAMREQIAILHEYFTWAGLRYSLAFHPWSAIALAFCIGFTASVLVWQSRNILFGLPQRERQRLVNQLIAIERQGRKHPLARWFRP